jgi:phosphoglycerate kinase
VIERFLDRGDDVLLGGAIANTFLAARGFDVGRSLYEDQFVEKARSIMLESEKQQKAMVHVPRDVVLASAPGEEVQKVDLPVENIEGDMAIYDIGTVTVKRYLEVLEKAATIIWNGPLGLYEYNRFSHGTKRVAEAVSAATKRGAFSVVGGGDTIDFHHRYNYPLTPYSFVSMGGGAMLEFISGKHLPALKVLER